METLTINIIQKDEKPLFLFSGYNCEYMSLEDGDISEDVDDFEEFIIDYAENLPVKVYNIEDIGVEVWVIKNKDVTEIENEYRKWRDADCEE